MSEIQNYVEANRNETPELNTVDNVVNHYSDMLGNIDDATKDVFNTQLTALKENRDIIAADINGSATDKENNLKEIIGDNIEHELVNILASKILVNQFENQYQSA
ncbi:MAG: hypothetical protein GY828_02140 [Candidatus Gracilibacteria bacterium]|nr:hypothetical protein [Candidatus Gracilibacteria bacterium]